MSDTAPKLTISGISKHYGEKCALNSFEAELTPGIYGLLGPNGAGKSTLMNIIVGNLAPDKDGGYIEYNKSLVQNLDWRYRAVLGFMPQQQGLYDSFTARRFLSYIAALKGISRDKAIRQIERVLAKVNLSDVGNKRLGGFSGGMKQRILIAQAMLGNPKILILDEPTAGLDPKERVRIRELIHNLAENKIVIVSTHIVSDIETIAKEILLLKKGDLIAKGSVEELAKILDDSVAPTLENVYMKYFGDE